MKLYIGTDHRGFNIKENIKKWLLESGYEIEDMGAHILQPDDDYTDYASSVAHRVSNDHSSLGIVFCGSGVGVDIVANKIDGIRSGYASSVKEVESAKRDDNINVLAVAADYTDEKKAKELIKIFLNTKYIKKARYERRIGKIGKIESMN